MRLSLAGTQDKIDVHKNDNDLFLPLKNAPSTSVYSNLNKKMAMKIGGTNEPDEVDPRQFEKLADEIGLIKPLVERRVIHQAKKMLEQQT
jgi:hypothetical protein